jgi:monoamine oxidase
MASSSWLDNAITLKPARFLLDVATASIFSAEPLELSLLHTVAYIASGSNKTTTRTIERLTSTGNGAQQSRVKGGTQLIAIKLAERLSK